MLKFIICDHDDLSTINPQVPHMLISILPSGKGESKEAQKYYLSRQECSDILHLSIDNSDDNDILYEDELPGDKNSLDNDMATLIWDTVLNFVETHGSNGRTPGTLVIVCCNIGMTYGFSKSSAIAASLAEVFSKNKGGDNFIWASPRYSPDMEIYNTMCSARETLDREYDSDNDIVVTLNNEDVEEDLEVVENVVTEVPKPPLGRLKSENTLLV
jgi:hypothetical protein